VNYICTDVNENCAVEDAREESFYEDGKNSILSRGFSSGAHFFQTLLIVFSVTINL
jgi:hypothetical protein